MKPGQLSAMRMMIAVVMMMKVFSAPHPTPVLPSHDNQMIKNENSTSLDALNWNSFTNKTKHMPILFMSGCMLPTCGTANLMSSMQSGDEKAGGATTDPFGNGKK